MTPLKQPHRYPDRETERNNKGFAPQHYRPLVPVMIKPEGKQDALALKNQTLPFPSKRPEASQTASDYPLHRPIGPYQRSLIEFLCVMSAPSPL